MSLTNYFTLKGQKGLFKSFVFDIFHETMRKKEILQFVYSAEIISDENNFRFSTIRFLEENLLWKEIFFASFNSSSVTSSKQEKEEVIQDKKNSVISYDGIPMQVSPLPDTKPLIVFINPKSGGRQGSR